MGEALTVYPPLDFGDFKVTVVWLPVAEVNGSILVEVGFPQDDLLFVKGTGYFPAGTDALPNNRAGVRMQGTRCRIFEDNNYTLADGAVLALYHAAHADS